MSMMHDAEQCYWEGLPRCIWCSDALPKGEEQACDRCGALACRDHCTVAISGEAICLECREAELRDIRRMARSEPLGEEFGVAV